MTGQKSLSYAALSAASLSIADLSYLVDSFDSVLAVLGVVSTTASGLAAIECCSP